MMNNPRPYLIIPELIEQPTWGGDYILQLKNWHNLPEFEGKKIGQSYELYGKSKLALENENTTDSSLLTNQSIPLADLISIDPSSTLGPMVYEKYKSMPLLIKLNQALGNSFQLHIKPSQVHPRWKPKPESWYFLEDGYISCGIKPDTDINTYKQTCVNIAGKMRELNHQVQYGGKPIDIARQEAKDFIKQQDPWQYVNLYETKKFDLIDLSRGGTHHSWEENTEKFPLGNIVFEIQLDVMDEFCTIRSFDQGKMKDDGSIREIHIDDYFTFIDTSPEANDIQNLRKTRQGNKLLQTSYYSLDILEIQSNHQEKIDDSFHHLYVQEGEVEVRAGEMTLKMTKGNSCFVPYNVKEYEIATKTLHSSILKTHIQSSS